MSQELNRKLAGLLGWKDIFYDPEVEDDNILIGTLDGRWVSVPDWTGDDGIVFRLVVKHGLSLNTDAFGGKAVYEQRYGVWESYKDHPDKYAAARVTVVKAVIAKLEAA